MRTQLVPLVVSPFETWCLFASSQAVCLHHHMLACLTLHAACLPRAVLPFGIPWNLGSSGQSHGCGCPRCLAYMVQQAAREVPAMGLLTAPPSVSTPLWPRRDSLKLQDRHSRTPQREHMAQMQAKRARNAGHRRRTRGQRCARATLSASATSRQPARHTSRKHGSGRVK